jgi:hypothetical protein
MRNGRLKSNTGFRICTIPWSFSENVVTAIESKDPVHVYYQALMNNHAALHPAAALAPGSAACGS